jgi:DNA repair photolyase
MYDYEEKTLVPQVKELTLKIIERLNEEGIKVTTLTKGLYPDEILDKKRFSQDNEYGITLVSLNEKFKEDFEPFSAPYADRIASLKKLADNGLKTWVSMEPYPTPELDIFAERVEAILEKISFAKKIIFGKLNYRRLTQSNAKPYKKWKNSDDFYATIARKVKNFCEKRGIKYHIKFGTPLNASSTTNIFKE